MPEEPKIADIQMPFLEYRANYMEPITLLWFDRRQGEIITALHKALSPWQLTFENISWNQSAKNLSDTQLTFGLPSQFATIYVGISGMLATVLKPDWSRAPVLLSLFQTGVDALKTSIGQGFQTQQLTLGMHLAPGDKPFRETMRQFVSAKALKSDDAAFFGVSVYYGDYSFVMDGSAAVPGGIFVKLTRNFAPEKRFEEMAPALLKDEEFVLRLLGLKLE
jgi:hypothetical protein